MIQAFLFDLDGVLVDLCDFHRDIFIQSYNRRYIHIQSAAIVSTTN